MCRSCMELLPGVPLSVMFDPHMPWLSALRVESSRMLSINADLTLRMSACTAVMTHASLCRCRLPSSVIPHGKKRCARDEICHDPAPSCVVSIARVVSGLVPTCFECLGSQDSLCVGMRLRAPNEDCAGVCWHALARPRRAMPLGHCGHMHSWSVTLCNCMCLALVV